MQDAAGADLMAQFFMAGLPTTPMQPHVHTLQSDATTYPTQAQQKQLLEEQRKSSAAAIADAPKPYSRKVHKQPHSHTAHFLRKMSPLNFLSAGFRIAVPHR